MSRLGQKFLRLKFNFNLKWNITSIITQRNCVMFKNAYGQIPVSLQPDLIELWFTNYELG